MVQIDDAGSGSFVGGTCIGVYRPETNEYYFDIIPVELYNKENFKKKLYLDEVVRIVSTAFEYLMPQRYESIEICRGYMFDHLKEWLSDHGFNWYCTQITGKMQEIVEKNFELYAHKLGLPWQYINYTRYPFHFHKLLRWVYADYNNRIRLCKIGWPSWQRLEGIIPEVSYGSMCSCAYSCMKCGKRIYPGSEVKIIRIISKHENLIYVHSHCYS